MRNDRLGFLILFAGLLAAAAVFMGVHEYQRGARDEQIRVQGVALARLLSSMTLRQVAPIDDGRSALDLLQSMHVDGDFAYAQVLDQSGRPMREVTAPGVIVPSATSPAGDPSQWFGERTLTDDEGYPLREFFAPLLEEAEPVATVRIGYRPGETVFGRHAGTTALVGVPVLLLALLLYLLLRRELAPLRGLREALQSSVAEHRVQTVELSASGEMGEFIRCFNEFALDTRRRQEEHSALMDRQRASTKVLAYHKARVETVLEAMPSAVLVMDETGVVTYVNQKLAALVGQDEDEMLGCNPLELFGAGEIREFLGRCANQGVRSNDEMQIEFNPLRSPDRLLRVSAYPLFAPRSGNDIYGTLVVFQDVTRESLARQARRDFVAHLSHELKTPLHVIGMYAETMLEGDALDRDRQIDTGNVISEEVSRVNVLIGNLLSIARIEAGTTNLHRKRVRLGDLLKDAVEAAARGAPRTMRLQVQTEPDLSAVNIDKDLMRVALNNLLSNAVKYNRPDGKVVAGAEEDGERIRIYVRDTGMGIPAEDHARIFQKFVRLDGGDGVERAGHGLGLALSHDIVELHHGRLVVESEPDRGSEFAIILPKTATLLREAA